MQTVTARLKHTCQKFFTKPNESPSVVEQTPHKSGDENLTGFAAVVKEKILFCGKKTKNCRFF